MKRTADPNVVACGVRVAEVCGGQGDEDRLMMRKAL